jgi:hypothetical protein
MEVRKDYFNREETYFLNSKELDVDIDFIISNKIDNIGINSCMGYSSNNINSISEKLSHVKKLHLECEKINLKGLESFKDLEYLSLMEDNMNFDFSGLGKLKHLFFTYDKTFKGLEYLINLETLTVGNSDEEFQSVILKYSNLSKLEIVQPSSFSVANIINKQSNYEKLELSYVRKQINLDELLPIKDKLKELRIFNCKKVFGYEYLKEFKKLEILVFSSCNTIKNSDFVNDLNCLVQLSITGSSFFEDGDIENLVREGLTVGIDNKKHYNLKSNQFLNYFRSPLESMP